MRDARINNEITRSYMAALEGIVEIDVVYGGGRNILFRGHFVGFGGESKVDIINRLQGLPGKAEVLMIHPGVVIKIQLPREISPSRIPWLNIVLFAVTVATTLLIGAGNAGVDFIEHPELIWQDPLRIIITGGPFAFSLLAILLFHEFGHYTASRLHGVNVTLPYFIPFPNFIGTMGAMIRIKSPFITRKQLFDVGAAGPLAGMAMAIPIAFWGLSNPIFIPEAFEPSGLLYLGDSLLFSFISYLVQPAPPDGYMAVINPVAFAAWVGFLVTMINLFPIGQLDGGHIIYAMFGKFQHKIVYVVIAGMVVLSFFSISWLVWLALTVILLKRNHPPTVMDEIPIDGKRMMLGYLCILIFILCFMPVPISN